METRNLEVYERALELARLLDQPLVELRKRNRDLEDQTRRALVSIALNIAEGSGKLGSSLREQARYYAIARGSTTEVRACLDLCEAWQWMSPDVIAPAKELLDRIRAMLYRLVQRGG